MSQETNGEIAKETWLEVKACIECPTKLSLEFGDYDEESCVEAIKEALDTLSASKQVEIDRLKEDYERVCQLVAKMHEAAVGEIRGPKRGVVEDVQDMRSLISETLVPALEKAYPILKNNCDGNHGHGVQNCYDFIGEALAAVKERVGR